MDISSKTSLRVIADYQAPYPDPIQVNAGEKITIDRNEKTDLVGWVWCTDQAGKSGWVPEAYIEHQGETGIMLNDYNAIELTIHIGEILTFHKAESGFFWVTNHAGQQGWVPASHVEPHTMGDE